MRGERHRWVLGEREREREREPSEGGRGYILGYSEKGPGSNEFHFLWVNSVLQEHLLLLATRMWWEKRECECETGKTPI
jgi:hypothetical protein